MKHLEKYPSASPAASSPFTRFAVWPLLVAATIAVGACAPPDPDAPTDGEQPQGEQSTPEMPGTVSILRPEIEPPEPEPLDLVPYEATIGFPKGGNELDEAAIDALDAALASPQMELGLPITLRAHGDSTGSDTANLNSTEKRGLVVAQWLVDNGIEADRITVIAFGEQNPVAPNALPDGSPNEEGRAVNRRVELEIAALPPVESVTNAADEADGERANQAASDER